MDEVGRSVDIDVVGPFGAKFVDGGVEDLMPWRSGVGNEDEVGARGHQG